MLNIPKNIVVNVKGGYQTVDPKHFRLYFVILRSKLKVA